jgi:hypothetical protein
MAGLVAGGHGLIPLLIDPGLVLVALWHVGELLCLDCMSRERSS